MDPEDPAAVVGVVVATVGPEEPWPAGLDEPDVTDAVSSPGPAELLPAESAVGPPPNDGVVALEAMVVVVVPGSAAVGTGAVGPGPEESEVPGPAERPADGRR